MSSTRALVWLSGLIALLIVLHAGSGLFRDAHLGEGSLFALGGPGAGPTPGLAAGCTLCPGVIFVAVVLLITGILLYTYSAANPTLPTER